MSSFRRWTWVLAGIFLAAGALGAQGARVPPAAADRVSVLVRVSGPKELDLGRYVDTLSALLMRSPKILSVRLAHGSEAGELESPARREGASVILAVELSREGAFLRAHWQIRATEGGPIPALGSFSKPQPSEDELATSFWVETVDAVEGFLASLRIVRLRVSGFPGAVIEGFGDPILLPKSGTAVLTLILPSRITWVASAPGRYPEKGTFYASEDGETLEIPRRQWALDFGAYGFSFPELRLGFTPDSLFFVRATLSQFALGLSLQSPNNGIEPPLILSFPLLQAGIGLGTYFAPQIRELRTYIAMDFFARLFSPQGRGVYLDPVAPIGVQPSVGLEWGRGPDARLYVEMSAVFYPWAMPGLMAASLDGNSSSDLIFGGSGWFPGHPGWFLEVPVMRIGMRFRL